MENHHSALEKLTISMAMASLQVYSTCSLHRLENEDVVTAALSQNSAGAFQVTSAVPWWRNAPLDLLEVPKNEGLFQGES